MDALMQAPKEAIFLTGTLPGSTPAAMRAMADYSAYAVNALKAWISKRHRATHSFYVWELQKRGALHLHYCLWVPDPVTRESICSGFKGEWARILDSIGAKSGIDMWARKEGGTHAGNQEVLQAYAQEVRKSVAAYMAGYCTGKAKHAADADSPYFPTRWWGVSRPLLKATRDSTIEKEVEIESYQNANRMYSILFEDHFVDIQKHYSYNHQYGLGKTAVAYLQPNEDTNIWRLSTMAAQRIPLNFKNYFSWTKMAVTTLKDYRRILPNYSGRWKPLLESYSHSADSPEFLQSAITFGLPVGALRALRIIQSEWNPNSLAQSEKERLENIWIPCFWCLNKSSTRIRSTKGGLFFPENDFPVSPDECWSIKESSLPAAECAFEMGFQNAACVLGFEPNVHPRQLEFDFIDPDYPGGIRRYSGHHFEMPTPSENNESTVSG
jgi:hypothetical protein